MVSPVIGVRTAREPSRTGSLGTPRLDSREVGSIIDLRIATDGRWTAAGAEMFGARK
jgi:hypothetical protein